MRLIRGLGELDRRLPFGAVAAVGAVALAVLVGGASAAVVKAPDVVTQAEPSPSPTPSSTPSPTPKPTPKADSPIDYLVDVAEAEEGWIRVPDVVAMTGPVDLEDAAVIEAGGKAVTAKDREALRHLGFVRGHSRAWRKGTVTVVVFVYEWKGTDGPLAFVRGMQVVNEGTSGWQPKTPHTYGVCKRQQSQTYDGGLAAVGKHSFLVVTLREGSCAKHEPAARMIDLVSRYAQRMGA